MKLTSSALALTFLCSCGILPDQSRHATGAQASMPPAASVGYVTVDPAQDAEVSEESHFKAPANAVPPPVFNLEYTFDTRGFNTTNLSGFSALRDDWSLSGFIDLFSSDGTVGADRTDTSRYFFELDLKRKLWEQSGVLFEVNDATGDNNALGRIGWYYLPKSEWLTENNIKFLIKLLPYETDGKGWQASLGYGKRFPNWLDGKFSIAGFLDANFDSGPMSSDTHLATETQFRYQVADGVRALVEVRLNEFLEDENGVGIGFQFNF